LLLKSTALLLGLCTLTTALQEVGHYTRLKQVSAQSGGRLPILFGVFHSTNEAAFAAFSNFAEEMSGQLVFAYTTGPTPPVEDDAETPVPGLFLMHKNGEAPAMAARAMPSDRVSRSIKEWLSLPEVRMKWYASAGMKLSGPANEGKPLRLTDEL